jgi:glutaredoxin 3
LKENALSNFLFSSFFPIALQVMVFARSYGPHNRQAKELLKKMSKTLDVHVEFLDVDLLPGWDGSLIMTELQEITGQWSFPNIFIGKKHVGGNQELDQKHALGELEDMIKNSGQEL